VQHQAIFEQPRHQRTAVAVIMLALLGCSLGLSYAAIHQPDQPVAVEGLTISLPPGWLPPAGSGRTNLGQTVAFTDPEGTRRRLEVTRFGIQSSQSANSPSIQDVLRAIFVRVLVGSTLGPDAPIRTGTVSQGPDGTELRYAMWTGIRQQRFGRALSQPQLWSIAVVGRARPSEGETDVPYWALVLHDQRSRIDPQADAPAQQGWLERVLNSAAIQIEQQATPSEQTE
jgi:hypothetical protein